MFYSQRLRRMARSLWGFVAFLVLKSLFGYERTFTHIHLHFSYFSRLNRPFHFVENPVLLMR